jgi:hypothetical protein
MASLLVLLVTLAVLLTVSGLRNRKLHEENKYLKESIALNRVDENPYYGTAEL